MSRNTHVNARTPTIHDKKVYKCVVHQLILCKCERRNWFLFVNDMLMEDSEKGLRRRVFREKWKDGVLWGPNVTPPGRTFINRDNYTYYTRIRRSNQYLDSIWSKYGRLFRKEPPASTTVTTVVIDQFFSFFPSLVLFFTLPSLHSYVSYRLTVHFFLHIDCYMNLWITWLSKCLK